MVKKQKEPLRLKEDTLEVGLERHRKSDAGQTSWVVEKAPWIALGMLVLIVIGWNLIIRTLFAPAPKPLPAAARLTAGAPTLVWIEGSSSQLQSVRISVVNSGAVHAFGVKVVARIRGRSFVLGGPETINSGESEVFSGMTDTAYRSGEAVDISTSCSNCR